MNIVDYVRPIGEAMSFAYPYVADTVSSVVQAVALDFAGSVAVSAFGYTAEAMVGKSKSLTPEQGVISKTFAAKKRIFRGMTFLQLVKYCISSIMYYKVHIVVATAMTFALYIYVRAILRHISHRQRLALISKNKKKR